MVNPMLSRKTEIIFTPVLNAKKLFQTIYREQNKKEDESDIPKIKVSHNFIYDKENHEFSSNTSTNGKVTISPSGCKPYCDLEEKICNVSEIVDDIKGPKTRTF